MARISISDLPIFGNCQFWRDEFPFEETTCCCLFFRRQDAVCLIFIEIRRKGLISSPLDKQASEKQGSFSGGPGACARWQTPGSLKAYGCVLECGHLIYSIQGETIMSLHHSERAANDQKLMPLTNKQPMVNHLAQQILLVEDHPLIQRMQKYQLETLKVVVHTADNGAQALEKIQTNEYALIIMDIGLPDQDGCKVAVAIHHYQSNHNQALTPIIALSAHINETEMQHCLNIGMIRAWNKPLDPPKMQEIAALLISGKI